METKNTEIFARELGYIKNDRVRDFVGYVLDRLPDYFRHIVETMEFLDYEKTDSLLH